MEDQKQAANHEAAKNKQKQGDSAQSGHGQDHAEQEQTDYEVHFDTIGQGMMPKHIVVQMPTGKAPCPR
ncbi:MAG TPA: hypothetical protein VGF39_09595 [Stellaceae bacterium]